MILVTGDSKADWWGGPRGKRTGPRRELQKEFYERSGQHFYAYAPDNFFVRIKALLQEESDATVVEETRAVAEASSVRDSVEKVRNTLAHFTESQRQEIARAITPGSLPHAISH